MIFRLRTGNRISEVGWASPRRGWRVLRGNMEGENLIVHRIS